MVLKITAEWLWQHGACWSERRRFAELWPNGATITIENVRKALAADLSLLWFINELCLPGEVDAYWQVVAELEKERSRLRNTSDWLDYSARYDLSAKELAECREEFDKLCAELRHKAARIVPVAFMRATRRFQSPRTQAATDRLLSKKER